MNEHMQQPPDLNGLASPLQSMRAVVGIAASNATDIAEALRRIAPGVRAVTDLQSDAAREVELLITWSVDAPLLARLAALRLVQANGAGVDGILRGLPADPGATRPVVCRTVDGSLADGMSSYVAWAALDHLRDMPYYREGQPQGRWTQRSPRLPGTHTVGIAGAGELGQACARVLSALGFPVRTWSRSARPGLDAGTRQFVGPEALDDFLGGCDTLVCLLPLTADTRGFLGRRVFDALPRGAHVINVGRGEHAVDDDVVQALRSGQLARATLDVASTEPPVPDHPFWTCPGLVLTPHIAARAGADAVAAQSLANLLALREGRAPAHRVDTARGY